uniref:Putative secreted peptide n=1 Tax=Anopheles braziliensis TaxID=58242 RepID=A0A2M3ZRV9_9DIPT
MPWCFYLLVIASAQSPCGAAGPFDPCTPQYGSRGITSAPLDHLPPSSAYILYIISVADAQLEYIKLIKTNLRNFHNSFYFISGSGRFEKTPVWFPWWSRWKEEELSVLASTVLAPVASCSW